MKQRKSQIFVLRKGLTFPKRAQDLPTTAMILLVLGFIALVVIVVIFQSQTGKVATGLASCRSKGGICESAPSTCWTTQNNQKVFNPYGAPECQTVCSSKNKAMLESTDCEPNSRICCIG